MTKQELMETYTTEQLAEMAENLQKENLVELLKLKNREDTEDVSKVLDAMKLTITELCNTIENLQGENKQEKQKHAKTLWEYCDSVKKEDYDREINFLQSEVEKYRKAFEDAKNERDCKIAEYQNRTEKDKTELERAKNTINQIDYILEKLFGVRHDTVDTPDELEKILTDKVKGNATDFLPTEPIKVADMLINAQTEYENNSIFATQKEYTANTFSVSELRQIAEHLLVYCNHNGEEEE